MASNWWNRFNQNWATSGLLDDPATTDANTGWAYIGQSPPTVEQFNSLFQWDDKKDNWLYNQIASVILSAGGTPSEGNLHGLLDSINAIAGTGTAFLPLAGGTMTGFLTLNAQPVNPLHAAPKSYIDNLFSTQRVPPPPGGWANGQLVPYGGGQFRLLMNSSTFIVPPGVTSIRVRVVGAGGSPNVAPPQSGKGAGGGGGGEYAHGVFTVVPGTSYAVTVSTGTTSFGGLISALPGGNPTALGAFGPGGTGGVGGDVRYAGGSGGQGGGNNNGGYGAAGGAAGSILGVGGRGGDMYALGSGGGGVGGNDGSTGLGTVGSQGYGGGGGSPFTAGEINIFSTTFYGGGADALGFRARLTTASTLPAHGTLRVGTAPRYAGETLTGGGGGGGSANNGTTPANIAGGNGGDGAGGGGGSGMAGLGGGNGGIFGGAGASYNNNSPNLGLAGNGGGGALNAASGGQNTGGAGYGGVGWCVVEW